MSGETWTLTGVILTALLTAIIAPMLDRRWRGKREEQEDARADRQTTATLVDTTLGRLLEEQNRMREQMSHEIEERDRRIDQLEDRIEKQGEVIAELRAELQAYRLGIAAPNGFISLPISVWRRIPEGVIAELPGRPFPGEDSDPGAQQ